MASAVWRVGYAVRSMMRSTRVLSACHISGGGEVGRDGQQQGCPRVQTAWHILSKSRFLASVLRRWTVSWMYSRSLYLRSAGRQYIVIMLFSADKSSRNI